MNSTDQADATTLRRIARRVEDILEAAQDRESKGQSLALDIDARFRLQDLGAVQFQLASAILEEVEGLRQEEVVSELLSLGLASVLRGAARAAGENGVHDLGLADETSAGKADGPLAGLLSGPLVSNHKRVVN
ncbi:MAG TPA: hypothetical protein VK689_19875 [Armatimonadota bacterium]|nr:hypothetical protein [Armatimonadota bacterium]